MAGIPASLQVQAGAAGGHLAICSDRLRGYGYGASVASIILRSPVQLAVVL